MKNLFYVALLFSLPTMTYGQDISVFQQNPRYRESQDRYMKMRDSLNALQSTTLQQTYKAYDWREARAERRQQRRQWRHEERLYNNRFYYNQYDPYFPRSYLFGGYYPLGGDYSPSFHFSYRSHRRQ